MVNQLENSPSETETTGDSPAVEKSRGILGMFAARTVDKLGLGLTIASGMAAAWNATRYNFYQNISRYEPFVTLKKQRDAKYTELLAKHPIKDRFISTNFIKEFNKIGSEHRADVARLLKEYDIDTMWARVATLKEHQKWEVGLTFIGVTSIVLGLAASVSASRRAEDRQLLIGKKLDELSKKLDDQEVMRKDASFVNRLDKAEQKINYLEALQSKHAVGNEQGFVKRLNTANYQPDKPNDSLAV